MRRTHSAGSSGIFPSSLIIILTVSALISGSFGLARAQSVYPKDGESLPQPPPRAHVIDDARLFSSEPQRLAELEARLSAVQQKYGFPIYVALYDTLISSSADSRAQELQDFWIGIDRPGMVAVFETDGLSLGMGVHPLKEFKVSTGSQIPDPGKLDLTLIEQQGVFLEAHARMARHADARGKVEAMVNALADEVSRDLDQRLQPASGVVRGRIIAFVIGMVAVAALVLLLVMTWLRRMHRRERQRYIFPEVHVGTRLGAPYGGGVVRSRDFDEPRIPRL